MTSKLNSEIDVRLRAFINAPDNYLDSIALVNCFHNFPILRTKEPYAIEVDGKRVTPVFTDEADCLAFQESHASAKEQDWVLGSTIDVLRETIERGLEGLVFNLKKSGDAGNTTFLESSSLLTFVNSFTLTLNLLMGEQNQAASQLEKNYLIPAFVHETPDGTSEDRFFPTMSNPDKESFVPAFSNLASFAKWYNLEDFGGNFRQAQGRVLTWKLQDVLHPQNGQHELEGVVGVVIDPFDDDMTMLTWEQLDK